MMVISRLTTLKTGHSFLEVVAIAIESAMLIVDSKRSSPLVDLSTDIFSLLGTVHLAGFNKQRKAIQSEYSASEEGYTIYYRRLLVLRFQVERLF